MPDRIGKRTIDEQILKETLINSQIQTGAYPIPGAQKPKSLNKNKYVAFGPIPE